MAAEREDFATGVSGTSLRLILQCLPHDEYASYREVGEKTRLSGKELDDGLLELEKRGSIQRQRRGGGNYYLKVKEVASRQWHTIDEAADYLRISRRTIYHLIRDGQLVAYRVGHGGHRRIKSEDLDSAMHRDDRVNILSLTAKDDPVLAELWDNDQDSVYDQL